MTTEAILLGLAQDAGIPQAGCYCSNCEQARHDPTQRQLATCLGLVDRATGQSWLIDATPDFREQLHLLHQFAPNCPLAGIILTHAHIGHYTGLIHMGREAMNTWGLPAYASARMADFLSDNAPWSQLVSQGNIEPYLLTPTAETQLSPNLWLLPFVVPHRDEFGDTLAFVIRGAARRLFYCPDIDSWDQWDHNVRDFVTGVDIALLDGTFFSPTELPGRDLSQIPHPLVTDTANRLAGVGGEVRLIHLNHSNPLLTAGPERDWLAARGLGVGESGAWWRLG
jgi:pyrroloquinoline quinone biosynthesis protein B